ncbi:hypothetical protein CWI66_09160 [Halomonas sp. 141]|uniref:hypothetical protein n=1 Tax=Halomonas sp. 141 TaxID=2056666 RepID=UPI000C29EB21|nr:hypothetical protein [Halomonas sp. 141]PJX13989.1 hypothetical protein CWI66_09160 [Halomonas sp. 141]
MNHNINLPLALFQANQDLCYQTMELTQKSQQAWHIFDTQPYAKGTYIQQSFDKQNALLMGLYEALLSWQVQTTKALLDTTCANSPALYWLYTCTPDAQDTAKKGE